jgi:hypothetical protein
VNSTHVIPLQQPLQLLALQLGGGVTHWPFVHCWPAAHGVVCGWYVQEPVAESHCPVAAYDFNVAPSTQDGAGGALQLTPAQRSLTHWPPEQEHDTSADAYEQTPEAQVPGDVKARSVPDPMQMELGGVTHVTPAHKSLVQCPSAHGQATSLPKYEQAPLMHTPSEDKTCSVFASLQVAGGGAWHVTPRHGSPTHCPASQPFGHIVTTRLT